jgi:two-component system, NtrC family, nitrogen regulation sensor histidine kinase NtrY
MLAVIVVSFVATGLSAYFSFLSQNEDYHRQRLERKEQSVTRSMDYFLQRNQGALATDSVGPLLYDKVMELADVHNILLMLFDLRGQFILSSDDAFLRANAIPESVDYTILKQLSTGNRRALIEKDVNDRTFLLTYWYIFDKEGTPAVITCFPYFDLEPINHEELRLFLIRITEVYLVLFVMTALLGFLLSSYITKNIRQVAERMRTIDLRKENKPIEWKGSDEIGLLVKEYNARVKELEESARMLARSERESAWREMARQVAHEIKNPLTPMKLRIQHIQKAWDEQAPDFDAKLRKLTDTLIEQIDTLSRIAGEFSYFAQMPDARPERLDLNPLLSAAAELYENEPGIQILREYSDAEALYTRADKDRILRVLNNLLANARQAIPEGRTGVIRIGAECRDGRITLRVSDNGKGISEADRPRIFTPNFTTKASGTGLGLAMVKQIVEAVGGTIWFESREGEGTDFFVNLKAD